MTTIPNNSESEQPSSKILNLTPQEKNPGKPNILIQIAPEALKQVRAHAQSPEGKKCTQLIFAEAAKRSEIMEQAHQQMTTLAGDDLEAGYALACSHSNDIMNRVVALGKCKTSDAAKKTLIELRDHIMAEFLLPLSGYLVKANRALKPLKTSDLKDAIEPRAQASSK